MSTDLLVPPSSIAQAEHEPLPLNPFEQEEYLNCWWKYLAPQFEIPFKKNERILIEHKKFLKNLVQLKVARVAAWNNAWDQRLTLVDIDALEETRKTNRWDILRLTWNETGRCQQMLDALEAKGYLILEKTAPPQYSIDLSEGMDAYLKGLSQNSRKSLKKKTRLAELLKPQLVSLTEESDIEPFLELFFSYHIPYWQEKTGFSYLSLPGERQFLIHWAKALHQKGRLLLEKLYFQDECVNMSMSIRHGQEIYWLLTINTGLHQDSAPGIVGLYKRLEAAAAKGTTGFHMGPGDYFYKIQSADTVTPCYELIAINPTSWKGKLFYHWNKRQAKVQ